MFRNVPACSGMFRVPGFIDGPIHPPRYLKVRIRVLHSQPTKWYEKFHLIYMKRLCITVGLEIA